MKRILFLITSILLSSVPTLAQERVIDATDSIPVSAASIFDFDGNVVGYTLTDGTFSDIPETAYPVTIRCLGYEPLVINQPKNAVWLMKQSFYDMPELVVVPVERNVMKQIFYIRKYLSLCSTADTITFFVEQMAYRFIPAAKDTKTGVSKSMHVSNHRCYSLYNVDDVDSVEYDEDSKSTLAVSIFDLDDEEIQAPKSFHTEPSGYYEKKGKSGASIIQKQSSGVFTSTEDALARKKSHSISPWPLKLLGLTMKVNQLYFSQAFPANEAGTYSAKDLMEATFVMEAEGRGKLIRKAMNSDTPVTIRAMTEFYVVDHEFLSQEEAKEESNKKDTKLEFAIPSSVPPLSKATLRIVELVKNGENLIRK